jgi:hypothetical protein
MAAVLQSSAVKDLFGERHQIRCLPQGGRQILSADIEQAVVRLVLEIDQPAQRVGCRLAAWRDLLEERRRLAMILAERAFGSLKGPDLQIRPIHHRLEDRVRAHVLICMLGYYLTWHLKAAWKPLLFTDEHRPSSPDPVAKAIRSTSAQQKAQTKRTSTGQPAHSYRTLLAELATQTRNTTRLAGSASTFEKLTQPTALQAKALQLAANAPILGIQ